MVADAAPEPNTGPNNGCKPDSKDEDVGSSSSSSSIIDNRSNCHSSLASFSMAHALSMMRRRQEEKANKGEGREKASKDQEDEEKKEKARAKRKRRRQNQKLAKAKAKTEASEALIVGEETVQLSQPQDLGANNDDAGDTSKKNLKRTCDLNVNDTLTSRLPVKKRFKLAVSDTMLQQLPLDAATENGLPSAPSTNQADDEIRQRAATNRPKFLIPRALLIKKKKKR